MIQKKRNLNNSKLYQNLKYKRVLDLSCTIYMKLSAWLLTFPPTAHPPIMVEPLQGRISSAIPSQSCLTPTSG